MYLLRLYLKTKGKGCWAAALSPLLLWVILAGAQGLAWAEDNPRGLPPQESATYIPKLNGLLNETHRNQYGQKRDLAECVVLRQSSVSEGKVRVPAGGLYYASSTSVDARPLMRDPMLLLGELAYLVRASYATVIHNDVKVKSGGKALLDEAGYRLWFEYATDHYGKPYGEYTLIAPSGGWPMEWPLSTSFPAPEKVLEIQTKEGINPQLKDFFMGDTLLYGATRMIAKKITHNDAVFSRVEYPVIQEAIFSLDRPYTIGVRQESFRWYGTKRIYAFRKEDGILIEVRNWTGSKVLASKLLKPSTQQEYKVAQQEDLCLTNLDLDLHIELIIEPSWYRYSDFAPWATGVPFGWQDGVINLAIYGDLVRLEDGKPWPNDPRYIVRLEPELQSGMLKRVVLENREPFVLDNQNNSYAGPVKISEVWDRRYFNLVVGDVEKEVVKNCYLRDSWFRRTDNLILWKDGKEDADFFVGMSELVVAVMEDTFLQRLADPSYGVPVVQSKFTSYPKVIPSAKWFGPDPGAAFVPKMKGFARALITNRRGKKLVASEALVIRGSYVDYHKGQIVIPPDGLYYTSRNGRNVRPLDGEAFFLLGRRAYLLSNKSYLVVKKDFRLDFWKQYPMGDGNLLFWQDLPLGDGSKAMRYQNSNILWGRPVSDLRITKYSGNTWGAKLLVAPGLNTYSDVKSLQVGPGEVQRDFKYYLPHVFAEGSTYLIPKWVTPDYIEVAEMGTPGMDSIKISYEAAKKTELSQGEEVKVGKYRLQAKTIDAAEKKVQFLVMDEEGSTVYEKTLGPCTAELYDTLPQYSPSQEKVMLQYDDIHVELDLPAEFKDGKVVVYASTGVIELERDTPWKTDPRYMIRPDVCGHCYMLNELILANKEPIILDADHRVWTGPEGYFRIVVDDFDGEAINAWHIEDVEGRSTPNLAEYARNNLDAMVGVNGTTETFLRQTLLQRLAYREIWRLK
jgi:hypothetical protein